jgi:hypothetical protein
VRDARFDNANSVLADLVELLERSRDLSVGEVASRIQKKRKCGIVLIARTELTIPQAASPVMLPDWFPIARGTTTSVVIEDLTWTADAFLNGADARIDEIGECSRAIPRPSS